MASADFFLSERASPASPVSKLATAIPSKKRPRGSVNRTEVRSRLIRKRPTPATKGVARNNRSGGLRLGGQRAGFHP